MAYGLEVYNSSGSLIVNQDYLNYQVISSGTIANGGTWPALSSTAEQIFVRASTAGATITSSSTWNGTTQSVYTVAQVSTGNIQYVIVKINPCAYSYTYGLRIFNSDGTSIAFDSGRSACKIVSSFIKAQTVVSPLPYWIYTFSQPTPVPLGRVRYISGHFLMNQAAFTTGSGYGLQYFNNYLTWTTDTAQTIGPNSDAVGYLDIGGSLSILTVDI